MHKVLVIGVGSIGERHVRCFQATRRAEVSLFDINSQLADSVAQRYGLCCCRDLGEATKTNFDAAVIATPAHLHVPMALPLIKCGLHLLIEKPLSTSLDGIDRLIESAQEHNAVASVAYVYRAHPLLTSMRQAIAAGSFGAPKQLVAVGGQHFPTYRPAYREIYYADRAKGGGAIQDALTHMINAGEWLVGPIDRLVADGGHQLLAGVEVEDTAHLLARHGSVMATYTLNQYQAPNELSITVVCESGTVRFEPLANRWRWMRVPGEDWHDECTVPTDRDALFVTQANAFLDAIEGTSPPACTLDEGLQSLRISLAALASLEQGCWKLV